MTYHFKNGDIDPVRSTEGESRRAPLEASLLHHAGLDEPAQSRCGGFASTFEDFAFRPMGLPPSQFWSRVEAHLQRLELAPNVLSAYPHQLSGGMRQRVTIALATVCQPEFVIADEPTTALDVVVQKDVLAMIRDVQRQMGSSVVFVTHDMSVHANIADRVGIIYAGRLVEEAPTRTLFAAPRHPYTAHLVAACRASATPRPSRRSRDDRPTLPNRPRAAASTLDARWPSTSARPRCRHSRQSGSITARRAGAAPTYAARAGSPSEDAEVDRR